MYRFYVSSYAKGKEKGLYVCTLDETKNELHLNKHIPTEDFPSYVIKKDDFLYVSLKDARVGEGGGVASYHIEEDDLKQLSFYNSHGRSYTHLCLSPDQKYLFTANYHVGATAAFPLKDHKIGDKLSVVHHHGSGIDLLKSPEEEEEHDHHHHHHPGGVDPHTWSSISGAKVIAKNTLDAFVSLDPENKEYYQANYEQLTKEIGETEKTVSSLLHSLDNKTFIIYHPALTYLANEYGLTQLCIEMDGKEPSPAQLKELVETAREHNAKVVFIQREFDQKNAELIAKETGCRLIPINPLDYDWGKEMIHIAKSLVDGQAD